MAREKNPSSKHRKEARKPGCSERQPNRPSAETLPVLIPEAAGAGQIEEALRQTEQRLALALSGARMGMYDRDIATGQTVCTEQVAQLLGLRTTTTATTTLSQAYDYHDWAERVHPEDRAGVEATLQRCMTERTAYEAEYRVVCPDGTVRWLADRGVFQYGPDGRPARLLGILMDINDRKMAEEALEHANEHLHVQTDELAAMNKRLLTEREELRRRSLELGQLKERADRTARAMERLARSVEENPDPALRVSLEGRIQYKNPAAYALCRQWNPDDTSRVPPAVQEIVSAAYARTETIRREMAFGRRVYRITVAPAPPPAQRVNIFARDITERKQAEEALRESERRFRGLVTVSSEVLYRMSPDWSEMRQLQSRGFLANMERPSRTWLEEYIPPDDQPRVTAAIQEAIRTKSVFELEHRVRRADGSVGWMFSRAVPLLDANGEIREWFGAASDITEHRQAEEALRESEERLHLALGAARMGAWQWEVGTQRVAWSPEVYTLLGYEPGRLTPSHEAFRQRIHPEDLARWEQALRRSMERCEDYTCEFRVVWPDGSVHWVEARGQYSYPRDESATETVWIRGVLADIEQRKQAEEALRENEQRLRSHIENSPLGVVEWDKDFVVTRWAGEMEKMLGWSAAETVGKPIGALNVVYPDDLPIVARTMQRLTYGVRRQVVSANRNVTKTGAVRYCVWYNSVLLDAHGKMSSVLSLVQDVTEQKQAEEALRRSEEQFHRLFDDDLTGNFICTPEGEILLCNPAFAAIFGFSRAAEAVGTSMADLYIDPAERAALLETLRKEGRTERLEVWRQRRDGTPIHIIENLVGLSDEQGELYEIKGYVFEDTQRKRAETALRERMKELACLYAVGRDAQEGLPVDELCRRTVERLVPAMQFPDITASVIELKGRRFTSESYTEGLSHGLHAEIRVAGEVLGHLSVYYARERPFLLPEEQNLVNGVAEALSTWLERQRAEEALRELNATLESKVTQRTAELRKRTRQLQQLTLEMSEAEDRERERLAHILHDDLQQELAAAKFHLSVARGRARGDPAVQEITLKVDEMLKDAIGKSRSLSHELSPAVLRQGDFAEALHWLADDMQDKHGLIVHVHGRASAPSDAIRAFLYRAAQELLFNAVKHAQVNEARVRVRQCGGCICLSVSDRGRGFDPDELRETAGFGLLSIRERIELLGGRMKIRSAPGKGSTFFVVVPGGTTTENRGRKTEGGGKTEEGSLSSFLRPPFSVLRSAGGTR